MINYRHDEAFTVEQVVKELAVPVTYGLINEINDAFHCDPMLKAFSIFQTTGVPDSMNEVADFGQVGFVYMMCFMFAHPS